MPSRDACRICSAWKCGAGRHSTPPCVSFTKTRGNVFANFAIAFPIFVSRCYLRGANAVGYTSYPDNVIVDFVREAYEQGIDIFRIFDSLNSIENMRVSIDAVLKTGAILRTCDLLHRRSVRQITTEIFAQVLCKDGQATGKTRRSFSGDQRHGWPLPPLRRVHAGESACAKKSKSRFTSTPTIPAGLIPHLC